LAAVAAAPAAASTLAAELRDVASDATLILRGHVTATRAVRLPGVEVSTVATVAVDRVLKGTADAFVSVVVPGGSIGGTRTVMVGAPVFKAGDAAVFFLTRGPDGLWRPAGLSMGVYRIHADRSGRPVVRPPILIEAGAAGPVERGDAARRSLSVSEFDALVGMTVATPAPASAPRRARPRR
jgi:hypothetical protein